MSSHISKSTVAEMQQVPQRSAVQFVQLLLVLGALFLCVTGPLTTAHAAEEASTTDKVSPAFIVFDTATDDIFSASPAAQQTAVGDDSGVSAAQALADGLRRFETPMSRRRRVEAMAVDGAAVLLSQARRMGGGTMLPTTATAARHVRVGDYIGGASAADDALFFNETDAALLEWTRVDRSRRAAEAKRAEAETAKRQRTDASASSTSEGGVSSEGDGRKRGRRSSDDQKVRPLTLTSAEINKRAKQRARLFGADGAKHTIEDKAKRIATATEDLLLRLQGAFFSAAATDAGEESSGSSGAMVVSGKTADAMPRLRAILQRYVVGQQEDATTVPPAQSILFSMLPSTASAGLVNGTPSSLLWQEDSSSSWLRPLSWYPPLHTVPFLDPTESQSLLEELRSIEKDAALLETALVQAESGHNAHDLKLKLALMNPSAKDDDAKKEKEQAQSPKDPSDVSGDSVASPEAIAANAVAKQPLEYYRSLRTYTVTPRITAVIQRLRSILKLNLRYQHALVRSSIAPLQSTVLPRLEGQVDRLRATMKLNDESTKALRQQQKYHNKILKGLNDDIRGLKKLLSRMLRIRIRGAGFSGQRELLDLDQLTMLIQFAVLERRVADTPFSELHPEIELDVTSPESAAPSTFHQPLAESIHVFVTLCLGLTMQEFGTLCLALILFPLIDTIVQTPWLWLRAYSILLQRVLPAIRRRCTSTGRTASTAPPPLPKRALLALSRGLQVLLTIFTSLYLALGCWLLPLVGVCFLPLFEHYVMATLVMARTTLRSGAGTLGGAAQPSDLAEARTVVAQEIPFTVFTLVTDMQRLRVVALLVVVYALVVVVLLRPLYAAAAASLLKGSLHKAKRS